MRRSQEASAVFTKTPPDIQSIATEFLDWVGKTKPFEFRADHFEFEGKTVYRFEAKRNINEKIALFGHGRSYDQTIAACKAASEVIERFFMLKFFGTNKGSHLAHQYLVSSGEFLKVNTSEAPLPHPELQSSNGWSVHFDKELAIKGAIMEALERHLLQVAYFRDGWKGFHLLDKFERSGLDFSSLKSNYSIGGFDAGVGIVEGSDFNGISLGYLCDSKANFDQSARWEQAFFECYDYYRKSVEMKRETPVRDHVGQKLVYFLNNQVQIDLSEEKSIDLGDLNINVINFDLAAMLNIPVPYFASFAFGGDLIPLLIEDNYSVSAMESISEALVKSTGKSEYPKGHPII